MTGKDRICVGALGGPHGLQGEMRLTSYTEDPATIADLGPLEDERGQRTFVITGLRAVKGSFAARIEGIRDRTAAERLPRTRLYVPRDRLPEPDPEDDEFYHADLIGMDVVDTEGQPAGSIRAVHDFGAGTMLELFRPGARTTVVVPFTKAAVPVVDVKGGKVVVDPAAAGLLPTDDRPEEGGPDGGDDTQEDGP